MAHTKAKGSSKNLRDSNPKYLGVKRQHGQRVGAGEIIIRQRGTKYLQGNNVRRGKDDTLYASTPGTVAFKRTKKTRFNGTSRYATKVSVL
jgi:large subunit ribosomal protein L27